MFHLILGLKKNAIVTEMGQKYTESKQRIVEGDHLTCSLDACSAKMAKNCKEHVRYNGGITQK